MQIRPIEETKNQTKRNPKTPETKIKQRNLNL